MVKNMIKNIIRVDCPYQNANCNKDKCDKCIRYMAYKKANNTQTISDKLKEINLSTEDDLLSIMFGIQSKIMEQHFKINNLQEKDINYFIDRYIIYVEENVYKAISYLKYDQFNDLGSPQFLHTMIDMLSYSVNMFIIGKAKNDNLEKKYILTYDDNIKGVYDLFKFIYDTIKTKECIYTNDEIVNTINNNKKDLFTVENIDINHIFDDSNKVEKNKENIVHEININNINMLILLSKILNSCSEIRHQIKWKLINDCSMVINYDNLYKCFVDLLINIIRIFKSISHDVKTIKQAYIHISLEKIFEQELLTKENNL